MEDDIITVANTKDQIKNFGKWMKRKIKGSCTKKMLLRRIPVLTWLPKYNSQDAVGDLVAGLTVGLTVIPQAIAYASIAGLPAQVSRRRSAIPTDFEKSLTLSVFAVRVIQLVFGSSYIYNIR